MVRLKRSAMLWAIAVLVALLAGGCGGSSKKKAGPAAAGAKGGTLVTRTNAAPSGSPDDFTTQLTAVGQFGLNDPRQAAVSPES